MRVLTINSHESYIYSLTAIDEIDVTIIDQMPGRYTEKWDDRVRPIPGNAQLITMEKALDQRLAYDIIIAHNLTDLNDTKKFDLPAVLIIHSSLDGLLAAQTATYTRADIRGIVQAYLSLKSIFPVSVSTMKAASWGIDDCPIIPFYIDTNFFTGYTGELSRGLRVANQMLEKAQVLNLAFFNRLVKGVEWDLVGHNPSMNRKPAQDLAALRHEYRTHRYYLHTAAEQFEDGYNTASLEAMATGMPVICNAHSSNVVTDGVTGFVSDDADYLRRQIKHLESDLDLAQRLGAKARKYVARNHSFELFRSMWLDVLESAVKSHRNPQGKSLA
ncbi:MAG: glycosyltransferase family 4 protein [Candidatus Marinimicrobia bacterium]|nr:glycosyltransferase family 4 protein [Candidatus Neomarinimicrobiota bacterium]